MSIVVFSDDDAPVDVDIELQLKFAFGFVGVVTVEFEIALVVFEDEDDDDDDDDEVGDDDDDVCDVDEDVVIGGGYEASKFLYKSDSKNLGYESFSISACMRFWARSNVSNDGLSIFWAVCARISISRLTSRGDPIATKSEYIFLDFAWRFISLFVNLYSSHSSQNSIFSSLNSVLRKPLNSAIPSFNKTKKLT